MKKEMGLHYMYDGEFWMEFYEDFCSEFEVRIFIRTEYHPSQNSCLSYNLTHSNVFSLLHVPR